MSTSTMDYSTSFTVEQTPAEVYAAILDPRAWWGNEIVGDPAAAGAEWSYRYKDFHYSKHRNAELVPGRKVVWHVVDATLNFVADKAEWTGTDIVFDIGEKDGRTELRFTHRGLVPGVECYDTCSDAWSGLITGSLRDLIVTGKGNPDDLG